MPTGAFTWAQTDAASGSWAYAIAPEPPVGTDVIGAAATRSVTHRAGYAAAQNRTWVHGTPPPLFPLAPSVAHGERRNVSCSGRHGDADPTTEPRGFPADHRAEQTPAAARRSRARLRAGGAALTTAPVSLDATGGALAADGWHGHPRRDVARLAAPPRAAVWSSRAGPRRSRRRRIRRSRRRAAR